ncbi:uncharacterized protein IUM83_02216 [Phytophthora cinnamomi]|uniref:uncharacterized protein n=1 Tax=Phytophthora cinnamomi TaxID=4785 RepID=UPI00355A7DD2|nr:hypothetical protein IUM83_02216 [Phytophthora cinnamomi]
MTQGDTREQQDSASEGFHSAGSAEAGRGRAHYDGGARDDPGDSHVIGSSGAECRDDRPFASDLPDLTTPEGLRAARDIVARAVAITSQHAAQTAGQSWANVGPGPVNNSSAGTRTTGMSSAAVPQAPGSGFIPLSGSVPAGPVPTTSSGSAIPPVGTVPSNAASGQGVPLVVPPAQLSATAWTATPSAAGAVPPSTGTGILPVGTVPSGSGSGFGAPYVAPPTQPSALAWTAAPGTVPPALPNAAALNYTPSTTNTVPTPIPCASPAPASTPTPAPRLRSAIASYDGISLEGMPSAAGYGYGVSPVGIQFVGASTSTLTGGVPAANTAVPQPVYGTLASVNQGAPLPSAPGTSTNYYGGMPSHIKNAVRMIRPFRSDNATVDKAKLFWDSFVRATTGLEEQLCISAFRECLKCKPAEEWWMYSKIDSFETLRIRFHNQFICLSPLQLMERLKTTKRSRGMSAEVWGDLVKSLCDEAQCFDPSMRYQYFLSGLRNREWKAALSSAVVSTIQQAVLILLQRGMHIPVEDDADFADEKSPEKKSEDSTLKEMMVMLQQNQNLIMQQQAELARAPRSPRRPSYAAAAYESQPVAQPSVQNAIPATVPTVPFTPVKGIRQGPDMYTQDGRTGREDDNAPPHKRLFTPEELDALTDGRTLDAKEEKEEYDKELEERLIPLDEVELLKKRAQSAAKQKELTLEELSALLNLPVATLERTRESSPGVVSTPEYWIDWYRRTLAASEEARRANRNFREKKREKKKLPPISSLLQGDSDARDVGGGNDFIGDDILAWPKKREPHEPVATDEKVVRRNICVTFAVPIEDELSAEEENCSILPSRWRALVRTVVYQMVLEDEARGEPRCRSCWKSAAYLPSGECRPVELVTLSEAERDPRARELVVAAAGVLGDSVMTAVAAQILDRYESESPLMRTKRAERQQLRECHRAASDVLSRRHRSHREVHYDCTSLFGRRSEAIGSNPSFTKDVEVEDADAGVPSEDDPVPAGKRVICSVGSVEAVSVGYIEELPAELLIDSGAIASLVESRVLTRLGLKDAPLLSYHGSLNAVSGHKLRVKGEIDLSLRLGSLVKRRPFVVVNHLHVDAILGTDSLKAFRAVIDLDENTMTLKDSGEVFPLGAPRVEETYVSRIASTVHLCPGGQALVAADIMGKAQENATVLIEGLPDGRYGRTQVGVFVAVDASRSTANPSGSSKSVSPNDHSRWVDAVIGAAAAEYPVARDPMPGLKDSEGAELGPDFSDSKLGKEKQGPIKGLLDTFRDMFVETSLKPGRTNLLEFSIDTGTNPPIKQPPYRVSRCYLDRNEIDLYTDHKALTWVFNEGNRTSNAKLARWAMELSQLRFKVYHKPGTAMGHVDGLSRLHSQTICALSMAGLLNEDSEPGDDGLGAVGEGPDSAPLPRTHLSRHPKASRALDEALHTASEALDAVGEPPAPQVPDEPRAVVAGDAGGEPVEAGPEPDAVAEPDDEEFDYEDEVVSERPATSLVDVFGLDRERFVEEQKRTPWIQAVIAFLECGALALDPQLRAKVLLISPHYVVRNGMLMRRVHL